VTFVAAWRQRTSQPSVGSGPTSSASDAGRPEPKKKKKKKWKPFGMPRKSIAWEADPQQDGNSRTAMNLHFKSDFF